MTWKDCLGVRHVMTCRILQSGGAVFHMGAEPKVVQVWARCGESTTTSVDLTNEPVDCMTCLVLGVSC